MVAGPALTTVSNSSRWPACWRIFDVARGGLLAGLAEVLSWVRQWHGEVDPASGQSPADAYTTYLEGKQREYGISGDDLKD